MTSRLSAVSLLLLAGCVDQKFNAVSGSDSFLQAPSNMVDILWVIDNSVSMANEQENVALGAQDFMARFEAGENKMDFHLGVISTDMSRENTYAGALLGTPAVLTPEVVGYADAFRARVRLGTTGADQEKGLQAARDALKPPLSDTRNAGFLRENAMLSIIILSDENDCSDDGALGGAASGEDCYTNAGQLTPVADLVRELKEIKGDDPLVMSGIVGPEVDANCDEAVPGRRYYTAIDMLGGERADICSTDYSVIMDSLGELTSGILTKFTLSKNANEETIEVFVTPVDGEEAEIAKDEVDGWTYISEYAVVEFHGLSIPPRGAEITINYEVAAGPVVEAPDTGTTR